MSEALLGVRTLMAVAGAIEVIRLFTGPVHPMIIGGLRRHIRQLNIEEAELRDVLGRLKAIQ